MEIAQKIKELAESHLLDGAHFIVDVVISKHKPYKVSVFLDGDKGVTIDDCSNLSRALSEDLDNVDLIKDNFTLEVGTPGLDQPLKLKRQYVKNVGRSIRLLRTDKGSYQGRLTEVTESGIVLEAEHKEKGKKKIEINRIEIPFNEIEKAIVMVSFK
ncbi:MAG: ribosome maturation factor RimP [Cyclobacteriaceae bacterium]|nr:ribosome maturation factor RimP [Cyclobacteriaceae bacterium]